MDHEVISHQDLLIYCSDLFQPVEHTLSKTLVDDDSFFHDPESPPIRASSGGGRSHGILRLQPTYQNHFSLQWILGDLPWAI